MTNRWPAYVVYCFTLTLLAGTFLPVNGQQQLQSDAIVPVAHEVLLRTLGDRATKIDLQVMGKPDDPDSYTYSAKNGRLKVAANTVNALTRGVYDYLKNNQLGMLGWAGPEFHFDNNFPDAGPHSNTSPFRIRQAYNAVTSGYTTPYWTWERWEQELDWQSMHGFNMLMAPVATEAIATRVWKRLGLTQDEIDSFYVGPSLLPWQRMGCIQQVGGSLPPEWHTDQLALQHKILTRMRALGMAPIVQSFAGFVPPAIRRIYPNLQLHETLWNAGFPRHQRPVMLMPGDPLFATITKMYMEEWQREFGEATYYLVDSFNELELPQSDKPVTELLSNYGRLTYDAIKAAQPNAVWVIQGWMFGYQSKQWPPENVQALFSQVPDNKVLILDYANDYANSWPKLGAFNGKQWVYGFVPNMGGKTAYTGKLDLYANGAAQTLASKDKKNLVGFSISGEGLENNEVVYELLADVAWQHQPVDLDSWLRKFSINRYGGYPPALDSSWQMLRSSAYSELIDHPQFNWQLGRFKPGTVNRSSVFIQSVHAFLSCRQLLQASPNYCADAIERTAIALGIKAEQCFDSAAIYYDARQVALGDQYGNRGLELLTNIDRLLESHPLLRLDRWVAFASAHSSNPPLQHFYEANARRIVTVWGPPVNDYSCRIWSGLVSSFYRERMRLILQAKKYGKPFDSNAWELEWVDKGVTEKVVPFEQPLEAAARLLRQAYAE